MKTFIITGTFEGQIELQFNTDGWLVLFDARNAQLNEEQRKWFSLRVPIHFDKLDIIVKIEMLNVVEQHREITFEDFYKEYGLKVGITKATNAWKRLSKADQMNAYMYLPKYRTWLNQNAWCAKMHPATYLNQKRWLD